MEISSLQILPKMKRPEKRVKSSIFRTKMLWQDFTQWFVGLETKRLRDILDTI